MYLYIYICVCVYAASDEHYFEATSGKEHMERAMSARVQG